MGEKAACNGLAAMEEGSTKCIISQVLCVNATSSLLRRGLWLCRKSATPVTLARHRNACEFPTDAEGRFMCLISISCRVEIVLFRLGRDHRARTRLVASWQAHAAQSEASAAKYGDNTERERPIFQRDTQRRALFERVLC